VTITSTVTDTGAMGDRSYAYGTFRASGAGPTGWILVPMGRVDYIDVQDTGGSCVSGITRPYGITFPYSSGTVAPQMVVTNIPITTCASGISGIWWAFGKRR